MPPRSGHPDLGGAEAHEAGITRARPAAAWFPFSRFLLSEPITKKLGDVPMAAGTSRTDTHEQDEREGGKPAAKRDAAVNRELQSLTTNQGVPIADNQNSLRGNTSGPTLLEDFVLREKITHFDHERIPERIVHARGTGVHGFFELTSSLKQYTNAKVLTAVGERTPVFVRFSTVAGGSGSVDTPRDVRGFAVKFYTSEGNWDLVGNNVPVFFIQDAMKFPDLVHAVKMEPDRGFPQASSAHDTFWDFIALTPESMHMVMWIMSDRTIPRSLRMMEGFGVHSFRLVDAAGNSVFVKFHWRPKLGIQSTLWDEAVKIAGADPDFHRRDMWEAVSSGNFPEWELAVQIFTQENADRFPFDHLDPTKLIPEELVPLKVIGRMVLDRMPQNFFAETEQVAFCPANVVPGIDFSNDPLLQGRLHSYLDTQLSRLGSPNFHQLPINGAQVPVREPPAGWPYADAGPQRSGFIRTQHAAGRCGPSRIARPGVPECEGRRERREGPGQGGVIRRPLQPGSAVLHQPDSVRTDAYRLRIHLRVVQGRTCADTRGDAGPHAQHRRGLGHTRGGRPEHEEPAQGSAASRGHCHDARVPCSADHRQDERLAAGALRRRVGG